MSLPHRFLRSLRSIHLYLGVFSAPMLLFFALTGGLQVFSLHETTRGSDYAPPAWLASAAQLHKKQTIEMPQRRRPPANGAAAPLQARPAADAEPRVVAVENRPARKNLLPMKVFFALVALSLFVSVLSGLYMAWRFSRRPALFGALSGAGIIVPLLLLLF
ncbi:PepSY domain-containing protein [Rhodanobacter sp. AS-Z3]|uniref:PepSY domain-containing protein n=1 Tax=Rhodanobacter sp. AS-Z3 TaxID=3031330 RepID=UPI002478D4D9|nr:PepSY domain-containing protein [Rhodanobacter sp. AS-Z3]WEN14204.1 PepSY domain-containing protein [Rhodanobacter sp. AS-Z3]